MSTLLEEYRSRLRESLKVINDLKAKVAIYERAQNEPIAIVGMACRFPGSVNSPDAYWNALIRGFDGVVEVPPERWKPSEIEVAGNEVRWAALIDGIDRFDASYFGISPREATSLDPQHRLLLEVTQEALDDAGVSPESLFESRTGVYAGICTNDYWQGMVCQGTRAVDTYAATGNLFSTAAGRISFWLGAQGPCVSIDTACSSSLVAVNLACQALRTGLADAAIVGGVNAILSPFSMTMMSRLGALSPDGRCKTFDARANGYVRGEGCGVVVLKRLSEAKRDKDRIRAVILGSAINQDGRSTGLTTPNVISQQRLFKQALENAQTSAADVTFIETHGTGTPLGDPIEVDALKVVYGQARENGSTCALGAVKTNIGHLEGAAGIAGLIKTVLCLEHETIPKNLHQRTLNPRIDLEGTPFQIPRENLRWPRGSQPRRAGVSSFGISGTNAHVILEEGPVDEVPPPEMASAYVIPISAKTPVALSKQVNALAVWLSENKCHSLHDIAYTAGVRRVQHEYRLAAIATSCEEFADTLAAFGRGEAPAGILQGRAEGKQSTRVLFVFSGQGSQWAEMGRSLFDQEPVFRKKLEEIEEIIRPWVQFSLLDEIKAPEAQSRLAQTEIAQPAIFAIQVALSALWASWGVHPAAVVGHSVGEIAAAHVAGALSLHDAIRLVVLRGRIMQRATGRGRMVAIDWSPEQAQRAIARRANDIAIAAINDPESVVLSGNIADIEAITTLAQQQGAVARPLKVDYAFHSPQMEPLARELVTELQHIAAQNSTTPIYSTVTGARINGAQLSADYWGQNVRATVNFAGAIQSALSDGHRVVVEIGPHPVLLANLRQCAEHQNLPVRLVSTLRRQDDGRRAMLAAFGALAVEGVQVDWTSLFPTRGRIVSLPTYAWQSERFWLEPQKGQSATALIQRGGHPLLGIRIDVSNQPNEHLWQQWLSTDAFPYLTDHRIRDEIIFPGSAYIELALAAARRTYGETNFGLAEISFTQMLVVPQTEPKILQLSVIKEHSERHGIAISTTTDGEPHWVRHSVGTIERIFSEDPTPIQLDEVLSRCKQTVQTEEFYEQLAKSGLLYGACFQNVTELHVGTSEVLARIELSNSPHLDVRDYILHPALLDASFQAAAWAIPSTTEPQTLVPIKATNIRVFRQVERNFWLHGQVTHSSSANSMVLALRAVDDQGQVVFSVETLELQALPRESSRPTDPLDDCRFDIVWRRSDHSTEPSTMSHTQSSWLILKDSSGLGKTLTARLRQRGERVVEVTSDVTYARQNADEYRLDPSLAKHWEMVLESAFGKTGCHAIIHCGALDGATWSNTTNTSITTDLRNGPLGVLMLSQAVLRQNWRDVPRLHVLTRMAQPCGDRATEVSVAQSTIWGMGRVLAMEQPDLGCIRIDLPPEPSDEEASFIIREIDAKSDEDQVALRSDGRHVARLVRSSWDGRAEVRERFEPAHGRPFRLEIHEPGVLERLSLRLFTPRTLAPREVEISVEAAGLNFLDVLKVLGIYPGMDRSKIEIGRECAGRIVAIGADVEGLHVGQAVIAVAPYCFANRVVTNAEFVVPMPLNLAFHEAATIPAVFMTVYWALHHVARLRRDERILIHAATGGTGLAAVQYAQFVGAEIFATAGNDEKRSYLRSLGIKHIMDSRSLAFGDEIMTKTQGRGVDVILNSLTGDAVVRGLEILAPYGRFLEISKKDIYDNYLIGLSPFRRSLSYTAIDLADMAESRPEHYGALLKEVVHGFESGVFRPTPVTTFPANDAASAFQLMAQAKHIGKIAIRMNEPETRVSVIENAGAEIRSDVTYMITGGLGGLGLSLAQWLISHGARSIALVNRSGPQAAAMATVQAMEESGATIRILQADISVRADVDRVIKVIDEEMAPLHGVVHAAAVLADRTLLELGEADFFATIRPKVFGAWNLHEALRERRLDFFIMYSSAAGVLGSPGQASYAAANAFLDALCQARMANGLVATSLQWGAFADVGLAAKTSGRGQRLASRGLAALTPAEGNELFGRVLTQPKPEMGIMRFDVRQWTDFYPQIGAAPFLAELRTENSRREKPETTDFKNALENESSNRRLELIETHVLEHLYKVLRLKPGGINKQSTFTSVGIDSLMSLELRNRLEASLALKLSPTLFFTYTTTSALAIHIRDRLFPAEDKTSTEASTPHAIENDIEPLETKIDVDPSEADLGTDLLDKLESFEEYLK